MRNRAATARTEARPTRATGQRFPIKYYLTAMLFIIFDIEIVFLYPWAVTVRLPRDCSRLRGDAALRAHRLRRLRLRLARGGLEWD